MAPNDCLKALNATYAGFKNGTDPVGLLAIIINTGKSLN